MFDRVHGAQRAYRKILRATSLPGTVQDLAPEAAEAHLDCAMAPGSLLLALVLLDAEVGFHVSARDPEALERLLTQLTYARPMSPHLASFLFVVGDAQDAGEALRGASVGTLLDPHQGATVIVETGGLDEHGPLELHGPGIDGVRRLGVEREPAWIALRAERNREYPLGVDLYLLDRSGRLVALPRTTQVSARG